LTKPGNQSIKPTIGEAICLATIVSIFLVVEIHGARLRPFWFDELSTLYVTVQPTWREMFQAMSGDGNPPLYFLLARLCLHLPVTTELALRLPSILAFPATGLAVFAFVRRVAAFPFALLSMCFLLGSTICDRFAVEARAYMLLMFFTAVLLCCWQAAHNNIHRRLALAGICVCTSGAILSHQYGIVYTLLPLSVGEAVGWLIRRHLDFGVLRAAALGALTILITYPPMLRGQWFLLASIRSFPFFEDRPRLADIGLYEAIWPQFRPTAAFFVVAAWALALAMFSQLRLKPVEALNIPAEDLAIANAMTLILPLMLLLTHFGTGLFGVRYSVGSALGISLLIGILTAWASVRWSAFHTVAWAGCMYCVFIGTLSFWIGLQYKRPTDFAEAVTTAAKGTESLVVASPVEFPPFWWYADASTRSRIHYLSDLSYAKRIREPLAEYSLSVERGFTPMQMDDYVKFIEHHREFMLYTIGQSREEWLEPRLRSGGWSLRLVVANKTGKLYSVRAPDSLTSRSINR
jgi:hypothetical protein